MEIIAPIHFITALHRIHESATPGAAGPAVERIVRCALAGGWVTPFEIEALLIETDPRLWQVTTRELLRVFGIPVEHVFERPTRGARDADGLARVSVVELARLLTLLERAGLAAGLHAAFIAPPAETDPLHRIMATIATDPAESGTVECPTCKGRLAWARDSHNGHLHARCETDGCLRVMQ